MFTDMNVSDDLNEKFNTSCKEENNQVGIDFSILVVPIKTGLPIK